MPDALEDLARQLAAFSSERDWEKFHSPKNLASALVVEAAELLEHFQWMTEVDSRNLPTTKREEVATELADVLLYLVQLSTVLGVDLRQAAEAKLKANALKYPVELAKGTSKKYNEL